MQRCFHDRVPPYETLGHCILRTMVYMKAQIRWGQSTQTGKQTAPVLVFAARHVLLVLLTRRDPACLRLLAHSHNWLGVSCLLGRGLCSYVR